MLEEGLNYIYHSLYGKKKSLSYEQVFKKHTAKKVREIIIEI